MSLYFAIGCDVWYKVTKMRANHNALVGFL